MVPLQLQCLFSAGFSGSYSLHAEVSLTVLDINSDLQQVNSNSTELACLQCSPWCLCCFNACGSALASVAVTASTLEAASVRACGLGNFSAGFTVALTDSQDSVFGSLAAALSELDSLMASGVVSVADLVLPVSKLASAVKLQLFGLPLSFVPPRRGKLQRWLPWQL